MKIERLLKMIILLLHHDILSASTLADTFQVTKRTIYRDIQTLEYAGFPIVSYLGKDGGFGLLDSFKLHTHTFTKEDKEHILEALTMHKTLLPSAISSSIKEKIEMLDSTLSETISFTSATLHNPYIEQQTNAKVLAIQTIIKDKKKMKITYVSNNAHTTTRIVSPLMLQLQDGSWYVQAFCDLRQQVRHFKLTRIQSLETIAVMADTTISIEPNLEEEEMQEITLHFSPNTIGKLYDFYPPNRICKIGDIIEVSFVYPKHKNLIPFLLMFGHEVQVIKPTSLLQQHQKHIKKMQKIYQR